MTLAVALAALAGCTSSDSGDPAPPPPKKEADKAEPAPEVAADADGKTGKRVTIANATPPVVTVEEAGADPKQALRFAPVAGTSEPMLMTLNMTMKMSAGGQKMPAVTSPPIITTGKTEVTGVTADKITMVYKIESMTVQDKAGTNPAMVKTMRSMLEGLEPFEAHVEMDARGVMLGGYVDIPEGLPAPMQQMMEQLQQSLAQIVVPLPSEPVGVGARWTSVGQVEQGGMKIQQTAHYSLDKHADEAVSLAVTVKQELVDPSFEPPGMPGVKGKIELFQSGGKGNVELSLTHLTPTSMSTEIKLKMAMAISAMGQEQKMDMDMDMGMAIERK